MYTQEEKEYLIANYPTKGKKHCCIALNKSEASIRYMASVLLLRIDRNSEFFKEFQERAKNSKIGKKRPQHSELMKKYAIEGRIDTFLIATTEKRKLISESAKKYIAENGHPKGMLGKKHSKETLAKMSEDFKKMWRNPLSKVNTPEHRQRISDRVSLYKSQNKNSENSYSRVKKGKITIGGKTLFARSTWEANIAAYFEFLKNQNQIKDWLYEPETFWFEEIKRGTRTYLPDFKIINNNESFYFVEVKGWMDPKSITKIKRMGQYYPEIKLDIIDEGRYKSISKNSGFIPDWGMLG